MSNFNEKLFGYFGGLFRQDDPTVQTAIVDTAGVPDPVILESADYNSGSISNELQFVKKYQDQLTSFFTLENAEGVFLDTLGFKWLGVRRGSGEDDALYLKRIKAYLSAYRNTVYGMEQIMRIFSPNFVLIQEGLSGFGAVTRSFIGWYTDTEQSYDPTYLETASSAVSAINPGLDTFTVADGSLFLIGDEIWHDDGVELRQYYITAKNTNDLTVNRRGYAVFNGENVARPYDDNNPVRITFPAHGLSDGDTISVDTVSIPAEVPADKYEVTVIDANTFSIPVDNSAGVGGTLTVRWAFKTGLVTISGAPTGTIRRYQPAKILKAYIGSIAEGILRIKVTIENNALTANPIIAKFIVDILNNSKIPGARVEVQKI